MALTAAVWIGVFLGAPFSSGCHRDSSSSLIGSHFSGTQVPGADINFATLYAELELDDSRTSKK